MVYVNIPITLKIFLRKGDFYDESGGNQVEVGRCQPQESG
jgi:hypothetical protein